MRAILVTLLLMTGFIHADEPPRESRNPNEHLPEAEEPGGAKSIESLRKEQIETLGQLVALYRQHYAEGLAGIGPILGALENLANAQLEAGLPHKQELEVLRKLLRTASEFEELTQARVAAGQSSTADHLAAKAQRLRIEIRLHERKQLGSGAE